MTKERALLAYDKNAGTWNVEYVNSDGKRVLRIGCTDKDAAQNLQTALDDAAWVDVNGIDTL